MRRFLIPLVVAVTLLAAACGGDPNLPEATGKGSVRAINAIPTSPAVDFFIEERLLGAANYQGATTRAEYDDLNYTFNFRVLFAGESSRRRLASRNLDIVADTDYTLLLSGTLASPTITVWEAEERTFEETDTLFALRFAHASATRGTLDYYFADPAVVPALGNQAATLTFGEVADSVDFTEGDYVLTITTAGDPADVVYTSASTTFPARDSYLTTAFDGDASDTAPVFVSAFGNLTGTTRLPDANSPPTVQFINASMDLGTVDIYDDEMLTSRIVADHGFRAVSPEIAVSLGTNTFYYTPAGATSTVLVESPLTAFGGLRYRSIAFGVTDSIVSLPFAADVRSVETGVKVTPFNASNNFGFVDVYALEPGIDIAEVGPFLRGLTAGQATIPAQIPAGTYDIVITETDEKTTLAGPYAVDVSAGDVVDLIVVDTVDPAVLDVLFLSGGPGT